MNVQILFAGIGGQGILFAARLFSELGLKLGLNIMGSETHGMSQRGGSVTAHLKLGDFKSPMIRSGTADILYAFDENEAYKSLKFLRPGGILFVNLESKNKFDKDVIAYLKQKEISFEFFDASSAASSFGTLKTANIILIGYSIGTGLVPFRYENLRSIIEQLSGGKQLELNLKALEFGFKQKGKHF